MRAPPWNITAFSNIKPPEKFSRRFDATTGKMNGAHGPIRLEGLDLHLEFFPYTKGIAAFISDNFEEYCLIHLVTDDEKYPNLLNPQRGVFRQPRRRLSSDSPPSFQGIMN